MDKLTIRSASLAAILINSTNIAFAGEICTIISDTSSSDTPILYNYFTTYINNNDPWTEIAHDAEIVSEDCPSPDATNKAYCIKRAEHPDNRSYFRSESYFRTPNSDQGYRQDLDIRVCVPDKNLVDAGVQNVIGRTRIAYGNLLGGNYKNKGSWTFKLSAKIWSGEIPICSLYFPAGQLPALIDCPTYSFVPPKSQSNTEDPEETDYRDRLRAKMEKLMENAKKSNDDYRKKAAEYNAIWDRIEKIPFAQLKPADFNNITGLWDRVDKLNKEIEALLAEKEILRNEFDKSWNEANIELSKIATNVGLSPAEYQNGFAFSIYSSSIQLQSIAPEPGFNPKVYQDFANNTITKLKLLNAKNSSTEFISESKQWLETAHELRELLQTDDLTTTDEWKALLASFEEVEAYIYSVVDREFWFHDSALTFEQKRALGHIRSWNEGMALIIERDLRNYREGNMTTQKREILTMLEVIGDGIGEAGPASPEADKFRPMVSDLAIAVKEGVVCTAKVLVAGDFADAYEVIIGKDFCSGEQLTVGDRLVTSAGLVVGNGRFYRMVSRKTGLTGSARIVAEIAADLKDKAKAMGMSDERLEALAKRLQALPQCSK
ncbi:MAG: pre-toxin TG domain-containing protein [Cellvibrionaceae bacterium]|nr:pre-toxin TG domain-containing protein [Cellvibrionaceae bacterium]